MLRWAKISRLMGPAAPRSSRIGYIAVSAQRRRRITHPWLGLAIRSLALAIMCGALAACSKTVEWNEEVKLNDGRVIVVTQKRRCEGGDYNAKTGASCVARESWLTLKLPEFSDKDIVWHESLKPMVVNIHLRRLYVVGRAPTSLTNIARPRPRE